MTHFKHIKPIVAVALVALLAGCGTHQLATKNQADSKQAQDTGEDRIRQKADLIKQKPLSVDQTEVSRPFLAGRSVPLAKEVKLPPALRQGVKVEAAFKGAESVDLMDAAAQLTLATGIPVRVRPDALIPQSEFLPRSGTTGQASARTGASANADRIRVNVKTAPSEAAALLNYICAQTGLYWDYKYDQNVIEIYRLVTRTFEFRGLAAKASVTIGLGRAAQQGASFTSTAETKLDQQAIDALADMQRGIDAIMTKGGTGSISNGTIVVTDTKDAVEEVGKFIDRENRNLNRRIRLVFETVDITNTDSGESSIDWSLVYSKIASTATGSVTQTLTSTALASLASSSAGSLGYTVTGNSRFSGSQLIMNALREVGTLSEHSVVPLETFNRRPIQYATRTLFDYVASVTASTTSSSAGVTTTPSVTQKEETVGTVLNITPSAFNDGLITLSVSWDNTRLTSLDPYEVSGTDTTLKVQQRTIDGIGTIQNLALRSGQTVVLGFSRSKKKSTTRRLDDYAPLVAGGSDTGSTEKSTTILMVTAVVEDAI